MEHKNVIENCHTHHAFEVWNLGHWLHNLFKKRCGVLVLAILCITSGSAQTPDFLPQPVVSPEAAMLLKFTDIPVSTYTGVPEISIPLYTISEDGTEVPITLRHHSSGVKVGEEATWVGLNWDLTVGGSITQVPAGDLDQNDYFFNSTAYEYDKLMDMEFTPGYYEYGGRAEKGLVWKSCIQVDPDADDYTTFNTARSFGWGQPDTFHLSLPGASAKFYINPENKENTIFGNHPTNIVIEGDPSSGWEIRDMNGIVYVFSTNHTEYSQTLPLPATGRPQYSGITWKLSKIILPSGKDIDFFYEDGFSITKNRSESFVYSNTSDDIIKDTRTNLSRTEHTTKYLQRIETDKEVIEFELSTQESARQDLISEVLDNGRYGAKRLNAVHIRDAYTDKIIKSFELGFGYFLSASSNSSDREKRLKLLQVQEIGYDQGRPVSEIPPYTFSYNSAYSLPSKDAFSIDHWGYYNAENNSTVLPEFRNEILSGTTDVTTYPSDFISVLLDIDGGNRGMNTAAAKTGLINKITYPTGGYSTFDYEANNFTNYPVLSAQEINEGVGEPNTGLENVNVVDLNTTCIYTRKSDPIYPDDQGGFKILDFGFGFTQTTGQLKWYDFYDAYVKIYRVQANGTETEIRSFTIHSATDSEKEAVNNGGGYTKEIGTIEYNGNPDDYYYVEAYLPDIAVLQPNGTNSCIPVATAGASFIKYVEGNAPVKEVSIGGGLRIKTITNYSNDESLQTKRSFKYVNEDGTTSSGLLMSPIDYVNYDTYVGKKYECVPAAIGDINDPNNKITSVATYEAFEGNIGSSSYYPVAKDAQGALVGYSRVEVTEVGAGQETNGKTVNFYKNRPSVVSKATGLPNIPYEDNGMLDSIQSFKQVKNEGLFGFVSYTYELVKQVNYEYQPIAQEKAYGVIVRDGYRGPDMCNPCASGISTYNPFVYYQKRWTINYYPLQTRWSVLKKTTDYEFFDTGNILSRALEYSYNELGQVIKEQVYTSKGEMQENQYVYPIDIDNPNPVQQQMKEKGFYNLLQESKVFDGNMPTTSQFYTYAPQPSGNIKPIKVEAVKGNGEKHTTINNVHYDRFDNIIQYEEKEGGVTKTLVWGYHHTYPVAMIENVTFAEVATALGITEAALMDLEESQLSLLEGLRETLPQAFVTTYRYDPLIGVTHITDPRGHTASYTYDAHNRLDEVKDYQGNIISKTKYNYIHLE